MEYVQSWITILNVTCAQVKKNTDLYRAIQNVCMFYHHHILWGFILGFLLVHVLYCSTEILDDFFFIECWQFNSVSDFFEWFLLMPHFFFYITANFCINPAFFRCCGHINTVIVSLYTKRCDTHLRLTGGCIITQHYLQTVYGDAVIWTKCIWHQKNAIFMHNFAMWPLTWM